MEIQGIDTQDLVYAKHAFYHWATPSLKIFFNGLPLILDENQEHWSSLSILKGTSLPQVSHDEGRAEPDSPTEKWQWPDVYLGTEIISIFVYQKGVITQSLRKPSNTPVLCKWKGWRGGGGRCFKAGIGRVRGQLVNILSFAGHTVSVLNYWTLSLQCKSAIDSMAMGARGWFPTKLYLQIQAVI